MRRRIIALCVTVLLLLVCSYQVFAEEFDLSKTGSITVTLIERKENKPVVGAELSVYYVATVGMDADGNLRYHYTGDFAQLDTAIDDIMLAEKLDTFLSAYDVPSVKITTDTQGTAVCEALPLGLYFVKQTGAVEGFTPCTSFLVTVPNEKDGVYVYAVNASPKTEVARCMTITIKKVWNTDASTEAADSVTVQLLHNDEVVRTAVLGAQNNWQVTYTDLPESDAYSIQEIDIPKGFTATYSRAGAVFTVTNTATLIQTGQRIWPIPILALVGVVLIAAGIALLQKKRNQDA